MTERLQVVELEGSCRDMGRAFGELERVAIGELYQVRMEASLDYANERGRKYCEREALSYARECQPWVERYDPQGWEELLGIAEGSGMSIDQLFVVQGVTDFRDLLSWGEQLDGSKLNEVDKWTDGAGCTSMVVTPERSASGGLSLAQSWDLAATNQPYVRIIKRKPNEGVATISLSLVGSLSLIGINNRGLAIGTNNLMTTDARIGVHYVSMLHKALSSSSLIDAEQAIASAHRCGGHYYFLGNKEGEFRALECSAMRVRALAAVNGIVSHCNHPLDPDITSVAIDCVGPSTLARQHRVDDLLDGREKVSTEDLTEVLSDHHGGELAICRHGEGKQINTNACVIMEPDLGVMHACLGRAHEGQWQKFEV